MVNITTPFFLKEGKYTHDLHKKSWEIQSGSGRGMLQAWLPRNPHRPPGFSRPGLLTQTPRAAQPAGNPHASTAFSTGTASRQQGYKTELYDISKIIPQKSDDTKNSNTFLLLRYSNREYNEILHVQYLPLDQLIFRESL